MKNLIIGLFLVVLFSCAMTDSSALLSAKETNACQEAANSIFGELDEASVKTLQETKKEELGKFHFSWGMGIRNSLGLWQEKSEIRLSCANEIGQDDIHADNASGIIMEKVWALVNNGS
ncbi:DUF6794 domain-containing protein [Alteromonas sp. 009811495]|uniref:DUF6794 domain-containing protein n=1 Tax=Alteromonas sp. 009811495 TaxID=3002962 RepID=UPI00237D60AD|nr:DUF6794 domain-containing protein [Alteromonas sp. 009811495]WDT86633.1 hypothetical protein OZ660_02480 [Alteromonas sp. 009811495]